MAGLGMSIIGGPNGCGKSTLARRLDGGDLLFGAKPINPDDLTRRAATELHALNGAGADLAGVERAEKAVWRAIAKGESAAVETVLSSEKYLDVPADVVRKRWPKAHDNLVKYIARVHEVLVFANTETPVLVFYARNGRIHTYGDPMRLPDVASRLL